MQLAKRTGLIDSSGIRKVFNLAQKMTNPINLSIGRPDFDVSSPVKDAAVAAIQSGYNSYTLTGGIPELKEKVLQKYRDRGAQAEDVLISSGVSGGLFLAFLTLLDPEDEILMTDPYFVMYKHLVNFIGAKPVFVDSYPEFKLDKASFEAAITEKTKAIIVNSPNNPTGICYTTEELQGIVEVAKKRNLLLITDDIYEHFYYGEAPVAPSVASLYEKTLILSGLSKTAAMTGWRLGYALGPGELIAAMTDLQQYSFVCAPSTAQKAALVALDQDMEESRCNYRLKRDMIYEGIKDFYDVQKPNGAFYIFPKAPDGDGDAFVERAIENNLLIVPGSVFSEKNSHFRISFAASDETLKRGVEVLRKIAKL